MNLDNKVIPGKAKSGTARLSKSGILWIGIAAVLSASITMAQRSGSPGGSGGSTNTVDLKKQFAATDEEWKVIEPKLRKLIAARQAYEVQFPIAGSRTTSGQGGFRGPGFGNDSFSGPSDSAGGFGPGGFGPGGPGRGRPDQMPRPEASSRPGATPATREATGGGAVLPPDNPSPDRGARPAATTQPTSASRPSARIDQMPQGEPPGFTMQKGPVMQAYIDLQTVLSDSSSTPDQVKEKLQFVRAARQKARAELEAAQKDLLELLTEAQQARLVILGYLD